MSPRLLRRHDAGGAWERVELPEDGLSLLRGGSGLELRPGAVPQALALLVRLGDEAGEAALVTGTQATGLLLNGYPPAGLAVLAERDEIVLDGERLYLTSRTGAERVHFRSDDGPASCARCGLVLQPGDVVIRCPACRAPCHEGVPAGAEDALLCWSEDARCPACRGERSALVWLPEEDDA